MLATKTLAEPELTPDYHLTFPLDIEHGTIYKPTIETNNNRTSPWRWNTNDLSHSIRASKTISEQALRQYLKAKGSPLQDWSGNILKSPYWSTIIGICTIEEYSCSVNPYGTNNLWGLMSRGHLIRFESVEAGIDAIDSFLARAEANGRTTVESFRGWYCYDAQSADHICWNWESVVLRTKAELESL